jgi:hypothetical protein
MAGNYAQGGRQRQPGTPKRHPPFAPHPRPRPLTATALLLLDRRTRHAALGTEHATIAKFGLQQFAAAGAVVEELASISRHGFGGLVAAMWTGLRALQDEFGRQVFRRKNESEVLA